MTANRLAGKALGDFLRVATGAVSSGVEKNILGRLAGGTEFVDAPGLAGVVARNPETVAKLAGAAAPVAIAGVTAAGAAGLGRLMSPGQNVYAQSQYSLPMQKTGTPVAFANQQYTAGLSPMTNAAVAEAMLEQQKFQHQLQLIQARQSAQQGVGAMSRVAPAGIDVMGLSKQIFSPVSY